VCPCDGETYDFGCTNSESSRVPAWKQEAAKNKRRRGASARGGISFRGQPIAPPGLGVFACGHDRERTKHAHARVYLGSSPRAIVSPKRPYCLSLSHRRLEGCCCRARGSGPPPSPRPGSPPRKDAGVRRRLAEPGSLLCRTEPNRTGQSRNRKKKKSGLGYRGQAEGFQSRTKYVACAWYCTCLRAGLWIITPRLVLR